MKDQSDRGGWAVPALALVVFAFTVVPNAAFWLSVANTAFNGGPDSQNAGLGLFGIVAGLVPLAAGWMAWRVLGRRPPPDRRLQFRSALWVSSAMSLLPLVIAAFVPV